MTKAHLRWTLLGWLAYASYEIIDKIFLDHRNQTPLRLQLWLTGSFLFIRSLEFFLCYLVVYPRLLRPGRLPALLGALAGVVAGYIGLRALIEEVLYPATLGFHNYGPGTTVGQYVYENIFYSLPMIGISAAVWAGQEALRRERENQQLTAEKRAAEAAFLKTQINPHFLYNTLNMLYGLAYAADKTLAGGILRLSELMRYMLRDTPDGLVELSQEIEYLENFLALYHLRYPGRLSAELLVTGSPDGHRLAPLLLIPFVENAFKHGILDEPATPVRLHLALTPGAVEFTVENHYHAGSAPDSTSGIGLPNLRRRLDLLYAGRFALQAGPVGSAGSGAFRARLELRHETLGSET